MNRWATGLLEKVADLEHMGASRRLGDRAREQVRRGDLADAEETVSHMELHVKAWMQRR